MFSAKKNSRLSALRTINLRSPHISCFFFMDPVDSLFLALCKDSDSFHIKFLNNCKKNVNFLPTLLEKKLIMHKSTEPITMISSIAKKLNSIISEHYLNVKTD